MTRDPDRRRQPDGPHGSRRGARGRRLRRRSRARRSPRRARPCARTPIALAILDVRLPDGDGIELRRRSFAPTRARAALPILMLSSEAEVARSRPRPQDRRERLRRQAVRHRTSCIARDPRSSLDAPTAPATASCSSIDDSTTFRERARRRRSHGAGYARSSRPHRAPRACALAAARRPAAIIVDGVMPDMDAATRDPPHPPRSRAAHDAVPAAHRLRRRGRRGPRARRRRRRVRPQGSRHRHDPRAARRDAAHRDRDARVDAASRSGPSASSPSTTARRTWTRSPTSCAERRLRRRAGDLGRGGARAARGAAASIACCSISMMPGLSGLETCRRIKAAPGICATPR